MSHYNLSYDFTFPVLNEKNRLSNGVMNLINYLKSQEMKNFTITIADNGSTDNTREIAQKLAAQYPEIKIVDVKKKGVGLALKKSWENSQADIIGYMDIDLATDINHLCEVLHFF